jgi:diacylglycerol kinase family enzyme/membrane-associated phospholipid phosphatase
VIEWFRQVVGQANKLDLAIGRWAARLPPTPADHAIMRLTRSANHGLLWFCCAAVLAARPGATRRGALRGVIAIAGASVSANALLKPLFPRRRPPTDELPEHRRLRDRPRSSSFPSGHAASAAAFATAVTMESRRGGLLVAPVAAAVAYSRVHVGVHWSSDVAVGAAVGVGSALLTRRWWPVRGTDEAAARPLDRVPALAGGAGVVIVVNPGSGTPSTDPTGDVRDAFPAADLLVLDEHLDLERELDARLARDTARATGAAGGDGTVAAVAAAASRHRLPLVLIPTGTLNHFARDVGVYDLTEAVDAVSEGEAVAVDLGEVRMPSHGTHSETTRCFLNTASLGCYSNLVRLRERWERRWGKWPSFVVALITTLRTAKPLRVCLDGTWHSVWVLFVGNGPYHPSGMVPAWRPRLDSRLLDVRWLRADVRLSRIRACFALLLAALAHSKVYHQYETRRLEVELESPTPLAVDGEVVESAARFSFSVLADPIAVYRRDERNPRWSDRRRPHHPW